MSAPKAEGDPQRDGNAVHHIETIQEGNSALALVGGLLICPMTFISSWWLLQPRQEAIVLNCGQLTAHVTEPGCHFHNSCGRDIRIISTAQISYDLPTIKVTDSLGNPIVVSAVVVYRFTNVTAALLNVQDPRLYVITQASSTLKSVVGKYTYDELKMEADEVQVRMRDLLQEKCNTAGATISSVSLNELNYAPEIAQAMLKKQAAAALVEARHLIVKGAVEIASAAIEKLAATGLKMTDENKFSLVSSLLVVTAGDKDAQPTLKV